MSPVRSPGLGTGHTAMRGCGVLFHVAHSQAIYLNGWQ
jgi:hypothetical protein